MGKNNCQHHANHPSHDEYLPRLNRASGQLEGIKKMIQERRYCPDIITQLHAVRSAIKSVTSQILEKHISTCVKEAFEDTDIIEQNKKIAEILDLIKNFN